MVKKLADRRRGRQLTKLTHYVPGVTLGVAIAVVALYLGKITTVFNDIIIAIVIGALIRNLFNVPANFKQGLTFCLKKVLRFAIILLGVQLSFQQIVKTGGQSLLLILAVVIIAIPLTYQIGKRLGLNSHMCVLLGVGSSICGASAILATGPAIKAKEGDIGLAVATVFIFNTLAWRSIAFIQSHLWHLDRRGGAGCFFGSGYWFCFQPRSRGNCNHC